MKPVVNPLSFEIHLYLVLSPPFYAGCDNTILPPSDAQLECISSLFNDSADEIVSQCGTFDVSTPLMYCTTIIVIFIVMQLFDLCNMNGNCSETLSRLYSSCNYTDFNSCERHIVRGWSVHIILHISIEGHSIHSNVVCYGCI